MRLTIEEIRNALQSADAGASVKPATGDARVAGIAWDSRQVKPGDLYVCLPGERVDGHDFASAAVAAGASAVLASRDVDGVEEAAVIRVEDTSSALTRLSAYWRARLGGTVIGLTGSTGKTTTKNLVRDVLSAHGTVVATFANQNNELGVPNTLLSAEEDTDAVVVEMGMRGMGQIAELCASAVPDWGLVTNVGESHIELLGSRENIARAKAELLCALPDRRGIAFVNAADSYAAWMCRHAKLAERGVATVFFEGGAMEKHADGLDELLCGAPFVWADDIVLDGEGRPRFIMHARGFSAIGLPGADGECACALELRGIHNVSNACSAAAVGLAAGMTLRACCDALASARPERGRQQVLHSAAGVTVVDDAYNANPDSMGASLRTFSAMDVAGRRIAVLGDMLELGDFARAGHERMGALAVELGMDVVICVGSLSRSMAETARRAADEAREEGRSYPSIVVCDNAAEALEAVCGLVAPGDAVLVKASHSIGLEEVVEGLVG